MKRRFSAAAGVCLAAAAVVLSRAACSVRHREGTKFCNTACATKWRPELEPSYVAVVKLGVGAVRAQNTASAAARVAGVCVTDHVAALRAAACVCGPVVG